MLSGAMMFDFMGWSEVGATDRDGIARTIGQKRVTYDLERLMDGATKLKHVRVRDGHHRKHADAGRRGLTIRSGIAIPSDELERLGPGARLSSAGNARALQKVARGGVQARDLS